MVRSALQGDHADGDESGLELAKVLQYEYCTIVLLIPLLSVTSFVYESLGIHYGSGVVPSLRSTGQGTLARCSPKSNRSTTASVDQTLLIRLCPPVIVSLQNPKQHPPPPTTGAWWRDRRRSFLSCRTMSGMSKSSAHIEGKVNCQNQG